MRVLHVAPSVARAYGGPTQSLLGYVSAAGLAGCAGSVAAPSSSDSEDAWFSGRVGFDCMFFRARGAGAFIYSSALLAWLGERGGSYDVIHIHGLLNPVSSLAARVCRRNRWAYVVRPFGTMSRYTFAHRRSHLKHAYFKLLDGPNLRNAQAVHFTTSVERDEADWHGLELKDRSHVVPPPFNGPLDAIGSGVHRQAGLRVLFLSRLHPVKNLETLLDAWALVARAVPGAELVVAGDGDPGYGAGLRTRAARLGIANSVRFVGFVDGEGKETLLREAQLFVLPSFHENFGISVLEAIAKGLPVIVSPEVQLSSFVREHGLGVVVLARPDTLAAAIVRALQEPALREHCLRTGPLLVGRYFAPALIGAQLHGMYSSALNRRDGATNHM